MNGLYLTWQRLGKYFNIELHLLINILISFLNNFCYNSKIFLFFSNQKSKFWLNLQVQLNVVLWTKYEFLSNCTLKHSESVKIYCGWGKGTDACNHHQKKKKKKKLITAAFISGRDPVFSTAWQNNRTLNVNLTSEMIWKENNTLGGFLDL